MTSSLLYYILWSPPALWQKWATRHSLFLCLVLYCFAGRLQTRIVK